MSAKLFRKVALAATAACFGVPAMATPCDSVISDYSYYSEWGYSSYLEEIASAHGECLAGGPVVSDIIINATSFTQAAANSRSVADRFLPQAAGPMAVASSGSGLAAGATPKKWNVWGNVEHNDTDYQYKTMVNTRTRGGADVLTSVIGADYAIKPGIVIGVSAAIDNGDGWGRNAALTKNHIDTDGFLIGPYIGAQINKELAVDASLGIGRGNYSASGGLKADADRWFAAVNLSYARWVNNWQFTGKASFMHGEEDYGKTHVNGIAQAFTETKNRLDSFRFAGQAAYWMNGAMPYVGLSIAKDMSDSDVPGEDPLRKGDAFTATVGVNFFSLSNNLTGGIFYSQEINRPNSDNRVIAANINLRF